MANTFAPFGFAESHRIGGPPNYQIGATRRYIAAANSNPIYFGDPVIQLASGYIAQSVPSGSAAQVSGIFAGCEYVSKSAKKIVWSPWWPGITSDVVTNPAGTANAGFDIVAKVIDDPQIVFRVQANGTATVGMIGMNATFTFGLAGATAPGTNPAPNQFSGISNVALDIATVAAPAVTAFPFRILDLIRDPPGVNGADILTPFNWVFVTFNNQDFKVTTGI